MARVTPGAASELPRAWEILQHAPLLSHGDLSQSQSGSRTFLLEPLTTPHGNESSSDSPPEARRSPSRPVIRVERVNVRPALLAVGEEVRHHTTAPTTLDSTTFAHRPSPARTTSTRAFVSPPPPPTVTLTVPSPRRISVAGAPRSALEAALTPAGSHTGRVTPTRRHTTTELSVPPFLSPHAPATLQSFERTHDTLGSAFSSPTTHQQTHSRTNTAKRTRGTSEPQLQVRSRSRALLPEFAASSVVHAWGADESHGEPLDESGDTLPAYTSTHTPSRAHRNAHAQALEDSEEQVRTPRRLISSQAAEESPQFASQSHSASRQRIILTPLQPIPFSPSSHTLPLSPSAHTLPLSPLVWDEPLLRDIYTSTGVLWPTFCPFIRCYDLFVDAQVTQLNVIPDCVLHASSLVALVNKYAPLVPVTLASGNTPSKIIITFRRVGAALASQTQPLPTYEITVRKTCANHESHTSDANACNLQPASALPAPLLPRAIPFVQICSVHTAWAGRTRGSLSAVPGMLVAVHRLNENEPWAFVTAIPPHEGDLGLETTAAAAAAAMAEDETNVMGSANAQGPRAGWLPRACLQEIDLAAIMPSMFESSDLCHVIQLFQATRDFPSSYSSFSSSGPDASALLSSPGSTVALDPATLSSLSPAAPTPSGPQPSLCMHRGDTLLITGMTRTVSHYYATIVLVHPDGLIEPRGRPGWIPVTAASPQSRQYAACALLAPDTSVRPDAMKQRLVVGDLHRATQAQLFSSFELFMGAFALPFVFRQAQMLEMPSPPPYTTPGSSEASPRGAGRPGLSSTSQLVHEIKQLRDDTDDVVSNSGGGKPVSRRRRHKVFPMSEPQTDDKQEEERENQFSASHVLRSTSSNTQGNTTFTTTTDHTTTLDANGHLIQNPVEEANPSIAASAGVVEHVSPLPTLYRGPPYFNIIMVMAEICLLLIGLRRGGIESNENPMLGPTFDTLKQLGARWPPTLQEGHVYQLITSLFVPVGVVRFCADFLMHALVGVWIERNLGFWRTAALFFGAGLVGNISGAIFVPSWLVAGPAPGLFGFFGAYVWLILRPSMGFAPINFSNNMSLLCFSSPAQVAPAPAPDAPKSRRGSLVVRVLQWRSIVTLLLLVMGLVLGPFPGSDNWSQVMALLPGGALALLLDPAPVAKHKLRDRGSLCVTALHCLCAVVLMKFVLFYLVTDVEQVCDWCIKSTCYQHGNWCDPVRRLGLNASDF